MSKAIPVVTPSGIREMTEEQAENYLRKRMPLDQRIAVLEERVAALESHLARALQILAQLVAKVGAP